MYNLDIFEQKFRHKESISISSNNIEINNYLTSVINVEFIMAIEETYKTFLNTHYLKMTIILIIIFI